ncbi:F-box protein At4g22390-like [Papaver somniferum]|uniref:F-box protein At4g22390-like n=1 Tax=Papaver somniferum TaxID=3469 RepID=UPI000E6F9E6C|nr:F-box protein At4g22390-like [Papaver somniferum]
MGGIFAKSSNMNGNRMGTMEEKETMNEKQLVLMPHLPEEIIIQILSRLSPRYLLKFRYGKDMYSIDNESLSTSSSLLDDIDSRCGLGYDSVSDDYKFVCIISNLTLNQSEAKIYSLRSNLWKPIQQISYVLSPQSHKYGVFCNGALHWLSSSLPKALIALHMTEELIRVISPPENPNFEHIGDTACIDVLDGCLGMLYCNVDLGFEVWLMKDYGKKESWTKFYSISKLAISLEMGRFGRLRRIKCLKTGEILLEIYHHSMNGGTREALVLNDPKNETSKFLKHDKDKLSSSSLSFHSYVKSSVSVSTKH